jgi:hypothetical protein
MQRLQRSLTAWSWMGSALISQIHNVHVLRCSIAAEGVCRTRVLLRRLHMGQGKQGSEIMFRHNGHRLICPTQYVVICS